MDRCEICDEDSVEAGKLQKLYKKGYENLTEQCRRISDSSLLERLERKWDSNIPVRVHRNCRSIFMQKEPVAEEQDDAPRQKRRKVAPLDSDKDNGKSNSYRPTSIL